MFVRISTKFCLVRKWNQNKKLLIYDLEAWPWLCETCHKYSLVLFKHVFAWFVWFDQGFLVGSIDWYLNLFTAYFTGCAAIGSVAESCEEQCSIPNHCHIHKVLGWIVVRVCGEACCWICVWSTRPRIMRAHAHTRCSPAKKLFRMQNSVK